MQKLKKKNGHYVFFHTDLTAQTLISCQKHFLQKHLLTNKSAVMRTKTYIVYLKCKIPQM